MLCHSLWIFGSTQLCAGDQPAEILIAFPRNAKQRKARDCQVTQGTAEQRTYLCADVCLNFCLLCRQMKTCRSINPIPVEQRHRRHLVVGTDPGQFLGNRSPFEEAESGTGMEFDVHLCNSVIAGIGKPMAGHQIAIYAIQRHTVLPFLDSIPKKRDIPFFAIPGTSLLQLRVA